METVTVENRARLVHEVIRECLYRKSEIESGTIPKDAVVVEGIAGDYGFHPERLAQRKADIIELLKGLPKAFYKNSGGGWTFLNLCNDASGQQWGEHPSMEALCCLAIGSGLGGWIVSREMWSLLPGSMPYVVFDLGAEE